MAKHRKSKKLKTKNLMGIAVIAAVVVIAIVLLFGGTSTAKFYAAQKTTQAQPIKLLPQQQARIADSDADRDGYSIIAGKDCNDNDAAIFPRAREVCNGKDDNCNGRIDDGLPQNQYFLDMDKDNYGGPAGVRACSLQVAQANALGIIISANGGDCNENNPAIHPNANEVCNGLDDNCNGQIDETCPQPEICDGKDNDLDGVIDNGVLLSFYKDADLDAFGNPNVVQQACQPPANYVAVSNDCDDANVAIYPGAAEACDKLDNDCDGAIDDDFDKDRDGYVNGPGCGVYYARQDCDDSDPLKYPGNGCP